MEGTTFVSLQGCEGYALPDASSTSFGYSSHSGANERFRENKHTKYFIKDSFIDSYKKSVHPLSTPGTKTYITS